MKTLLPLLMLTACPDDDDRPLPADPTIRQTDSTPDSGSGDSGADDSTGDGDSGGIDDTGISDRVGALIDVSFAGKVGVRINGVPASIKPALEAEMLGQSEQFWLDRAYVQAQVIDSNLYYRGWNDPQRGSLPLPPDDVWEIVLSGAPYYDDALGAVMQDFSFHTVIVTTADSPIQSDPFLASEGGMLEETVSVPVDPVSTYQEYFYLSPTAKFAPGVQPPLPVADMRLTLMFERLPWDRAIATDYNVSRIYDSIPQLRVLPEGLDSNYVEWVWIPEDDCAVQEQCVTGTGWRRLLRFDASVHNQGEAPLHIGYVGGQSDAYTENNVFVYSQCHEHYHFGYYGDFFLDAPEEMGGMTEGDKKAFCLISTTRRSNNAATTLTTDYEGCDYQGIAAGWGDDYSAYLDCQWIDITDLDTDAVNTPEITAPLQFTFNPDRFICEGTLQTGGDGEPTFSPSEYTTDAGEPVGRPDCDFIDGWDSDNTASRDIAVPATGSAVTGACVIPMIGGTRNCGYRLQSGFACAPGQPVTLRCTADAPQVIRVCEGSHAQGDITCTNQDAIGREVIDGELVMQVDCPEGRGGAETGGLISVLTAPVYSEDAPGSVVCGVE